MGRKLLVVGTRDGGLGHWVAKEAQRYVETTRADLAEVALAGQADVSVDVTDRKSIVTLLEQVRPTGIVCTVGINLPDGEPGTTIRNMERQLMVNALGPIKLLVEAVDFWSRPGGDARDRNFVAVSSNSAHVARSQSAGYCASKAALSMAVRSIARRLGDSNVNAWVYEPGWLDGTPMSEEVRRRLKPGTELHRIPGGRGVDVVALAQRIVADMLASEPYLNGTCIRVDGGEQ